MSKGLNDGVNGVRYDVPQFYLEEYPLFIEFMNTFYDWLYNDKGFTPEEIQKYLSDTSWLDTTSSLSPELQLIDLKTVRPPGVVARDMQRDKMLVREFTNIFAMDSENIQDVDGRPLLTLEDRDETYKNWYETFGFQMTTDYAFEYFVQFVTSDAKIFMTSDGDNFNVAVRDQKRRQLDHSRWLKLLKHVYRIRGTKKAMELFFWLYFGSPIVVKYPKERIARLDDNFVLDGDNTLRDDNYYNEFSYVIRVPDELSKYQGVFDKIYRRHFHPAGFTVFLESTKKE